MVLDIVEHTDITWVGCVDYANSNTGESDIYATRKRYQSLVESVPIREKINPDWSAALSINDSCRDKPCVVMFANESYTHKQDERCNIFIQPGGLWLRLTNSKKAAKLLFGKESAEPWEYFAGEQAPLQRAAKENGSMQNPDIHIQIEYRCHSEHRNATHENCAYIPITY